MTARILSAIVAILLLAGTHFWGGPQALYGICSFVVIGCAIEYSRLTFTKSHSPKYLQYSFILLNMTVFFATNFLEKWSIFVLVESSVLFLAVTVLTVNATQDLTWAVQTVKAALLGFMYCAVFPAMVTKTISLPHGDVWLFGLLGIVFAGDTFAYFSGKLFGKTKLLEAVSPKKTVEGALGGLGGSLLAGWVLQFFFFKNFPLSSILILALATGIFAQIGDLFESLLKRVAEVKDSGSIMPGHGGLLDRVDGVYFAGPVYFLIISLLTGA